MAIDDELHGRDRASAAEPGMPLPAGVRQLLTRCAEGTATFESRRRLQDRVLGAVKSFRAGGGPLGALALCFRRQAAIIATTVLFCPFFRRQIP